VEIAAQSVEQRPCTPCSAKGRIAMPPPSQGRRRKPRRTFSTVGRSSRAAVVWTLHSLRPESRRCASSAPGRVEPKSNQTNCNAATRRKTALP
jgi:hypothetical protein